MPNYQQITIMGHAGSDPEVRYAGDNPVANFSVAVSEKWKDKSGQQQEHTEWFRCTVWGATAEKYVGPFLHKGDAVWVKGKMKTRKWQDNDGNDRYSTELIADRFEGVQILSSPKGQGGQGGGQGSQRAQQQSKPSQGGQGGAPRQDFDDDLPF